MAIAVAGNPANRARSTFAIGPRRAAVVTATMDASYPTNGLPADFSTVAGFTPAVVLLHPRFATGGTGPVNRSFMYDYANKKIVAIVNTTGVEVANATDLSGVVFDVILLGD